MFKKIKTEEYIGFFVLLSLLITTIIISALTGLGLYKFLEIVL